MALINNKLSFSFHTYSEWNFNAQLGSVFRFQLSHQPLVIVISQSY